MSTSKAWRARLPRIREDQLAYLEQWARDNCALHMVFRESAGTVLLGLDARQRTAASFARTLRSAFNKRAIDTRGLRGHWLRLVTVQELLLLIAGGGDGPSSRRPQDDQRPEPPEDEGTRVITLF